MVQPKNPVLKKFVTVFSLVKTKQFTRIAVILEGMLRHQARKFTRNFSDTSTSSYSVASRPFRPLDVASYGKKKSLRHLKTSLSSNAHTAHALCILDQFSALCWAPEWNIDLVTPDNWENLLNGSSTPDLLFVESAWRGSGGAWTSKLNQPGKISSELLALIEACRKRGIPTVFWNKEDPPHFSEFCATACLFDYIFTTDANMIAKYEELAPHATVGVLPFAAQPSIHNPARNSSTRSGQRNTRWHQGDIAFAGTYFQDKFAERREQLAVLLKAAVAAVEKQDRILTIFTRTGNDDRRYRFPSFAKRYIAGTLAPEQMLEANHEHKIFLNANSVTNSPTMCARRIFELTASGASVVSMPNPAISTYFDEGDLGIVEDEKSAVAVLTALLNSEELRERQTHRAQRTIWNSHTYSHRARHVLEIIGLKPAPGENYANADGDVPRVSIICSTNRPENVTHLVDQVLQQTNVTLELVLCTHGFSLSAEQKKNIDTKFTQQDISVEVFSAPVSWTLGDCLNAAVDKAHGKFVAKFDDDDYYLPHYLEDQINAIVYSNATVVGKQATVTYLQGSDLLMLRRPEKEHIWTNFVAGPTLFAKREVFQQHPFKKTTRGEDTQFLQDVIQQGGSIYSADRFNFIQFRGSKHTWAVTDTEFLAQGRVISPGFNESYAEA